MIWNDGGVYVGDFFDDKLSGIGLFTYNDCRIYSGLYAFGIKHGHGIFTWPNGDCYEGDFVNDCMHGNGVMTLPPLAYRYVGQWSRNQRHGRGIETSKGKKFKVIYENDNVIFRSSQS
jgi:hypothetical protein